MLPLRTQPELRQRVWGGHRLTAEGASPVGEAWLAGPGSRVVGGPSDGATLEALAALHGSRMTGNAATEEGRFPLLIKILDPAAWLSIQVHPDDDQARMLEGPGAVGKTEAWYVLEAAADAEILLGVRPSVPPEAVRGAIRDGAVADLLERRRVTAGEAYLVPAGTLHAVGPGALMYEIQQPSDITYRCDDWGRPAGPDRPLHTDQALACVRATPWTSRVRKGPVGGAREEVVGCDRFVLEGLRPGPARPVRCDTMAASVHVLTTAAGSAVVAGNGWVEPLDLFETLVVPADAGRYTVAAPGSEGTLVLLARLPSPGEP